MKVAAVPVADLSSGLRNLHDLAAKEGGRRMIRVTAQSPKQAELYWTFYNAMRFENSLGTRLTEIIRVVAASTTECQVCFSSDRDEASGTAGLSKDEIAKVDATGGFSPAELAAIAFTRKLGTDHLSIDDADFGALHAHFSQREIVEIGILASQFIGFGRLSAVFEIEDPQFSLGASR